MFDDNKKAVDKVVVMKDGVLLCKARLHESQNVRAVGGRPGNWCARSQFGCTCYR